VTAPADDDDVTVQVVRLTVHSSPDADVVVVALGNPLWRPRLVHVSATTPVAARLGWARGAGPALAHCAQSAEAEVRRGSRPLYACPQPVRLSQMLEPVLTDGPAPVRASRPEPEGAAAPDWLAPPCAVEEPPAGGRLPRTGARVDGWTLARHGRKTLAVVVAIDGVIVATGTTGCARPDVEERFPANPGARTAGFSLGLPDLTADDRVPSTLTVRAVEVGGDGWLLAERSIWVGGDTPPDAAGRGASIRGAIDVVEVRRDPTAAVVRGWAMQGDKLPARVSVSVDGTTVGIARLGLPRPDLAALMPGDSPVAGWEFWLDPQLAERPELRIGATVWGTDTATRALPERRERLAAPTPRPAGEGGRLALLARRMPGRRRRPGHGRRLVVLAHALSVGGAQRHLADLVAGLVTEDGWEVSVASLHGGEGLAGYEAVGCPVHVTGEFPLADAESYEGRVADFCAWLDAQQPTVVLANTAATHALADAATRLGVPLVWSLHEGYGAPTALLAQTHVNGGLAGHVADRLLAALASAQQVVFFAEATRRLWIDACAPGTTQVIPYAARDDAASAGLPFAQRRARARAVLGLADADRLLLCLGTVEPRKQQAVLASCLPALLERHPQVVLALVGAVPGADLDAVRELRQRLGPAAARLRVELVTDPRPWLDAAELLVIASDIESLPITLLEAAVRGVPVLSTAVAGIPELVTDGATGLLVAPRDRSALLRGLDRALSLPPEALGELGSALRSVVRERHDPATTERRMLAVLEDASASGGRSSRPGQS